MVSARTTEHGYAEVVLQVGEHPIMVPLMVDELTGHVDVYEGSLDDFSDNLIAAALAVRMWLTNKARVDGVLGEIEAKP